MDIYTSYLSRRDAKQPEEKELADVITEVKSAKHQKLVRQIAKEPDKNKRNDLKGFLPLFFPTVQFFDKNTLADNSKITGIIQFDIDIQDNEGADFDSIKEKVVEIPETIYAFKSPSGGLKFGLLTDFNKHEDESLISLKKRYIQAYTHCKDYISRFVEITHDENMQKLKFACYLSWDQDAYYNNECKIYSVDSRCDYTPPVYSTECYLPASDELIDELLGIIPSGLGYHERFRVNCAIFGIMGNAGIPILFNHWSKPERNELQIQLEHQAKSTHYGSIGQLVNIAKGYGYKPVPPAPHVPYASLQKLTAKPVDYQFEPLLTVEQASNKLRETIQSFFDHKKSMVINVSAGYGKTQTALEILRRIPSLTNVLYLVKDHTLADEIVEKFNNIPHDEITQKKWYPDISKINHIKGKRFVEKNGHTMCQNPKSLETYKNAGIHMPLEECTKNCMYEGDCTYTQQFSRFMCNIRLMTHNEFVNEKSAWFFGTDLNEYGAYIPSSHGWMPEYIIIDEDWLKLVNHKEIVDNEYVSILNIITDCINGIALEQAVNNHAEKVIDNFTYMESNYSTKVKYEKSDQYIQDMINKKSVRWSNILKMFNDYVINGYDPDELKGIRFVENEDRNTGFLILSKMKEIAKRYKDIPILYLDATADEVVVKSVVGNIEFHSIKVKNNEWMNIYQLENRSWSKKQLKDAKARGKLVDELKPIVARYNVVGLITYMNLTSMDNFDEWLAKQLGITIYGHFGKLRGQDVFKDVDCLLVVGRNMIRLTDYYNYAHAIFDDVNEYESEYVDVPVRMKNGTAMTVCNQRFSDIRLEHIHQYFSISESIQAVGRGRLIHGKPKDVYIYSNESLGSDIEITGFIRYEKKKYKDAIIKLKVIGFCRDKTSELRLLGLTQNSINADRKGIDTEFREAGIQRVSMIVIDKHRNARKHHYYYSDRSKLKEYLKHEGLKVKKSTATAS